MDSIRRMCALLGISHSAYYVWKQKDQTAVLTQKETDLERVKKAFEVGQGCYGTRRIRESVEEVLNGLLDAEADHLTNARKYERTEVRQDTRAGHYLRKLLTSAGEVELVVPKLHTFPKGTNL